MYWEVRSHRGKCKKQKKIEKKKDKKKANSFWNLAKIFDFLGPSAPKNRKFLPKFKFFLLVFLSFFSFFFRFSFVFCTNRGASAPPTALSLEHFPPNLPFGARAARPFPQSSPFSPFYSRCSQTCTLPRLLKTYATWQEASRQKSSA